jgi:CheY-like chemotaxis protein
VCVISTDDAREQALQAGALCFLSKPLRSRDLLDEAFSRLHQFAQQPARRLLVALPEGEARRVLAEAFHEGVDALQAADADSLRAQLHDADVLVIDATLQGCSPEDVREAMESHPLGLQLPVVLWNPAGADAGVWERQHGGFSLRRAGTAQELLGYASLALHRNPAEMDEAEAQAVEAVTGGRCSLRGRKALIVDDDMRNIFALATVLDDHGSSSIQGVSASGLTPSTLKANVKSYEPGKISIDLTGPAAKSNVLVLSENYYPGWSATSGGTALTVSRVNYNLIGVENRAGGGAGDEGGASGEGAPGGVGVSGIATP